MLDEARKRDHRKIGTEMGLFTLDPDYAGPGLPLWLPKGAAIIEELEKLARETEFAAGYQRVRTPHLAKEKMYITSGHLPYYQHAMFPPMQLRPEGEVEKKIQELEKERQLAEAEIQSFQQEYRKHGQIGDLKRFTRSIDTVKSLSAQIENLAERDRYYLKAMNCPHHHRIFAAEPRSYRDLPLRLAEYGACYRYEQSGELFGLMRVRCLNMNDAHIYCAPGQFAEEFNAVNQMYLQYFKIFGIEKYVMRFSTHDPSKLGEKFVDEPELWKQTEEMVRQALIDSGINFVEVPNEAAFYGPKIDVQVWSVIGREFTLSTNQVDFAVPRKFGLVYRDRDNTEKTPLCIHRAPLGTHERFVGFLIEHYAGNFPLWLAPEQVRVLTIGEEAKLIAYAREIVGELRSHMVRAQSDFTSDPIKAKIAEAELAKVHTMLVIGPRDLEAGNVSLRLHGKGNLGAKPRSEAVADILAAIRDRAG
jgi:threonyl-tRNA synthetase